MFAQLLQMTGPSPESCPLWQSKQCAVLAQSFPRILVLGFMFFMCLYKCVHLCAWWLKHTHDCCASGVLVWVISVSTQPRQSMAVLLYMTLITDNYISGTFREAYMPLSYKRSTIVSNQVCTNEDRLDYLVREHFKTKHVITTILQVRYIRSYLI